MPFTTDQLQPGDVLLYTPKGVFSRTIAVKTWSRYSHCELYLGQVGETHYVYASRDPVRWFPPAGGGVNIYRIRLTELGEVRRPTFQIDTTRLHEFVLATTGQKYDWWGLLRFFNVGQGKPDRMFCSEAVVRALRFSANNDHLLFDNLDADQASPGMLAWTRDLATIYHEAGSQ